MAIKTRKIVISGGHKKVHYLLQSLAPSKHRIVVINKDKQFCKALSREFDGATIIHGDASEPDILEDAGIAGFDLAISLCNRDEDNLVISMLMRDIFDVKRTVALVNQPQNVEFFDEAGIDSTINSAKVIAGIIEQHAFTEKLRSFTPFENEELMLVDIEVPEDSPLLSKKISDIKVPEGAVINAIYRDQKAILPRSETMIEAKDRLIITTFKKARQKTVKAILEPNAKPKKRVF